MRRKMKRRLCLYGILISAPVLAWSGMFMYAASGQQHIESSEKPPAAESKAAKETNSQQKESTSVSQKKTELIEKVDPVEEPVSQNAQEKEESEIIPVSSMDEERFYYDQLDAGEMEVFDMVFGAVRQRRKKVNFQTPIDLELLEKIVYIIRWDFPEMYYLDPSFSYSPSKKGVVSYTPGYCISEADYDLMQQKVDAVAEKICEKTKTMSRYKKEVYIHDWLIENITYTEEGENTGNLYGALIEGKAKCDGYSSSMQYLLRKCGVRCGQVIGQATSDGKTEGHAWNLVEMPDGWYYTDACWDDLEDTLAKEGIAGCYDYLNLSYPEMMKNRTVDETLQYLGNLPEDNLLEYNYYRKSGLYASSTADAEEMLAKGVLTALEKEKTTVLIKCRSNQVYTSLKEGYASVIQEIIDQYSVPSISCRFTGLDSRTTAVFVIELQQAAEVQEAD